MNTTGKINAVERLSSLYGLIFPSLDENLNNLYINTDIPSPIKFAIINCKEFTIPEMEEIIDRYINFVNQKDKLGDTALIYACKNILSNIDKNLNIMELLIRKGADVNPWKRISNSPLSVIINLYIKGYLPYNLNKNSNGICDLDEDSVLARVMFLIIQKENSEDSDFIDDYLLHFIFKNKANREEFIEVLNFLLRNKINLNLKNYMGMTILQNILSDPITNNFYLKTIELLLINGASVDITDTNGNSIYDLVIKDDRYSKEIKNLIANYKK